MKSGLFRRTMLAVAAVAAGSVARADVVATFEGNTPNQLATTSAFGTVYNGVPVGPFNFTTVDAGGTQVGSAFRGFCADYFQGVSAGETYTFSVVDISALPDIGTNATKLTRIQNLYDKHYAAATDAEAGGAFQLAMWELTYDGANAVGLGDGNFTATGDSAVALANRWLADIDTPNAAGQQYTLLGLLSPTNQDQITAVPNAVPAPAGVVLVVIGAGLALARRRFAAKKVEATEQA